MKRSFLAKGDRAGDAVITQGLATVTCSNPPPRVEIATLGMSTYCNACKRAGFIAPRGPRHAGTGPNGKQWALSGDINVCGCSPAPVFYAERNMSMSFTAEESATLAENDASSPGSGPTSDYSEQVLAASARGSLIGYPYVIETSAGAVYSGRIEFAGLLPRIFTDDVTSYTVHWGDDALAHEGWT
ncbi:hypothetical protein [Caballeronia sp. GAFFF1]|uniref:hypothetical protein n=1 Tax=Caballeronia sp. GAFFF1 TaxID=2921779 RepID=UPI002028332B|nr:hypothetical protein [Caballeronia sp. GAFFF1]